MLVTVRHILSKYNSVTDILYDRPLICLNHVSNIPSRKAFPTCIKKNSSKAIACSKNSSKAIACSKKSLTHSYMSKTLVTSHKHISYKSLSYL